MATAEDVIKELEVMKKELLEAIEGKQELKEEQLGEFNLGSITSIETTNVQEFLALASGAGLGDPIRDKIAGSAGGFGGMLAGATGKAIVGAGLAMFIGKNNKIIRLFGQGMVIDAVGDYIKDFAGQFLK